MADDHLPYAEYRKAARVRSLNGKLRKWAEKRKLRNLEHQVLVNAVSFLNEYAYILENLSEDEVDDLIEAKRGRSA